MACSCKVGGGNTGVPFCSTIQDVPYSVIIVPKYANDGSLNAIDLENDTLNQTYFDGKINAQNWQDRWFPLPAMENIETARAESLSETANSGNIYKIKDGVRSFTGYIFEQSAKLVDKLKEWECIEFGVYELDQAGQLAGQLSADGTKLYPRYVLKGSMDAILANATDSTVQKIMVSFNYAQSVKDGKIGIISASSLVDVDLLNLSGLLDVNIKLTNPSTTGVEAALTLDYGDVLNPIKVEGAVVADFVVFNKTQSTSVVVSGAVESPAGGYALSFAAQTSADVLQVSLSKNGYSSQVVEIAIP